MDVQLLISTMTTVRALPSKLVGCKLTFLSPPPSDSDELIAGLLSNPECIQHLRAMSKADSSGWTSEDAAKRREFLTTEQHILKGWFCNVYTGDTNVFVGISGLRDLDWNNRSGEMGIIISPEHWGKGYSGEIHYVTLGYGFEVLKLERIIFVTASSNTPMISFCRNTLQAVHEGTGRNRFARSWTDPSQGYDDTEHFSILSAEWPDMKKRLETKFGLSATPV